MASSSRPKSSSVERTPLLSSPSSVSQHHGLAPPSIRFPRPSVEQQNSYGFPSTTTNSKKRGTSMDSQSTLVNEYPGARRGVIREDSKVYTSFPIPEYSPWESSPSPDETQHQSMLTRLLGKRHQDEHSRNNQNADLERQPGLPKVSRQCLWAEIKCYGKHILPVLLVFLVAVLVVALSVYNNARH